MSFLLYLCGNYDIKSCWQYFRQWKQLYTKTGRAVYGHQRQQRGTQANAGVSTSQPITLPYTGYRPAAIVDDEENMPLDDVCWGELFGSQATLPLRTRVSRCTVQADHEAAGARDAVPWPAQGQLMVVCFVTAIVSTAILDRAFHSPTLTSIAAVFAASVSGPVSYTRMEWLKRPVFRRCDAVDFDSPLPYRYLPRTSTSTWADSRSIWDTRSLSATPSTGQASDAVRDRVMRRNNHSNVFQDAYLNANVIFDVQNARLGRASADPRARHVGHTRVPRATSDMVPDGLWASLPPDPEVVELERQRAALKGGKYRVKGSPQGVQRLKYYVRLRLRSRAAISEEQDDGLLIESRDVLD
ncbi:hypothetical protein EDB86DRAFT_2833614 [Lactarius hatsudake]|nr:hypothetical protein EDB86DRAFT_2833614 [Lactarius hatsudake]